MDLFGFAWTPTTLSLNSNGNGHCGVTLKMSSTYDLLGPAHTTQLYSHASCRPKSVGDRNVTAVRRLYLVWLQISII